MLSLGLMACQSEGELNEVSQMDSKEVEALSEMAEKPISLEKRTKYNEFILNPENQNWQALDKFYRNVVANKDYQQADDFGQMKQSMFLMMVVTLDLMQDESKAAAEARDYYWQEFQNLDFQHPEVAYRLLNERQARLGKQAIKPEVDNILAKNEVNYRELSTQHKEISEGVAKLKQL